MNYHWNVLYQVSVFYADQKSKMATNAGHEYLLDGPLQTLGFFLTTAFLGAKQEGLIF